MTAQQIETRSAIDAKRRGPKGESPVAKPCAQAGAMHQWGTRMAEHATAVLLTETPAAA